MVERASYSYTDTDERDKYGNFGKPLSKPGKCKLCGATVLRLYEEGICLMCKINRTAEASWKVIPRPKSTLFYSGADDTPSRVLPPPKSTLLYGGEKGEALSGRTALSEKLNSLSGRALFKPERCKLCDAKVWTFYDEGICLNCKIKRRKVVSKFPELSKVHND